MKIISAFPGTGKTYWHTTYPYRSIDSDSSKYSWIQSDDSRVRNPLFPSNYIKAIRIMTILHPEEKYILFVSTHKVVRDQLVLNEMPFVLVYPDRHLKDEYINRFKERGDTDDFISLISTKWNEFIDELDAQTGCSKAVLQSGQYLSAVL